MWTPPLPGDPVGRSSYECDYGGGSTGETGGRETPGIQRRSVENHRVVLARGSQCTAPHRRHSFLLEQLFGVLV